MRQQAKGLEKMLEKDLAREEENACEWQRYLEALKLNDQQSIVAQVTVRHTMDECKAKMEVMVAQGVTMTVMVRMIGIMADRTEIEGVQVVAATPTTIVEIST